MISELQFGRLFQIIMHLYTVHYDICVIDLKLHANVGMKMVHVEAAVSARCPIILLLYKERRTLIVAEIE